MNRKVIGIIISFCLILILTAVPLIAACTPAAPEGELVFVETSLGLEVWGLDVGATPDRYFLGITNENLISDPREGEEARYQPELAESWTLSEDGVTWDFYLREGVQWQGGWGEFTAEDVLFSFQEISKAGSVNGSASKFRIGGEGSMASYEVVSPYHFRMTQVEPDAETEGELASVNSLIVSKKHYEGVGYDSAIQSPIGTGPWRLIEHKVAEYVRYEAVENHWRQTPQFKHLTIRGVPELSGRLAMLKTGAADISSIPADNKAELEASGLWIKSMSGADVVRMPIGGMVLPTREGYDPTVPWVPHQDEPEAVADHAAGWGKVKGGSEWNQRALKVRMAMFYAVDIDAIIDNIYYGEAVKSPIFNWMPFGTKWVRSEWKPILYDPELAKQLLIEAGYPDGFEITFLMYNNLTMTKGIEIGEAISRDWEAIGLTVKRELTEWTVVRPIFAARESAWKVALQPMGPNPEPWQSTNFVNRTTSPMNYGYESYDLDELTTAAKVTLDLDERVQRTLELGDYLYERYIQMSVVITNMVIALSPKIEGFPFKLTGFEPDISGFEYITRAD